MWEMSERTGSTELPGLVGLARRAGALEAGVAVARAAIREGRAHLVLLAADAADGQLRKVRSLLEYHPVPTRWVSDRAMLGQAVGTASVSVAVITDRAFAEPLGRRLPEERPAAM
ncbi:MAG: hypothetical protein EA352_11065 [Gemmatimonadales bacterium]|nr:MAG: hypothetical protein EA352_11065 [Gemmatimonadales bacterium]